MSEIRFSVSIGGDPVAMFEKEYRAAEYAVTRGIAAGASAVKTAWRGQITGAGLGNRLARTIRSDVYPEGRPSANAAAMIFSKAPVIVRAHNDGPTIRSSDGFWLAIPLPQAGKSLRGGRISPGEWERRTGRRLRFVYRPGRTALLVDDGTVITGARVMRRDGYSRAARGFKNRTVPIFALVPQVKLKKRLDVGRAAEAGAASVPSLIVANWR